MHKASIDQDDCLRHMHEFLGFALRMHMRVRCPVRVKDTARVFMNCHGETVKFYTISPRLYYYIYITYKFHFEI